MLREIQAKSILNKTKRRDPWFLDDYTLNPYSGCSFNCLYCYIRGSKYGVNMEERLSIKSNAIKLLEKVLTLRARKNQYGIIVLSSATDPYLPPEKNLLLTRGILDVIAHHRFPLHIITKSDMVVRDFDILKKIEQRAILPPDLETRLDHRVFITFSFSTTDDHVAKKFEPGAILPSRRLDALKRAGEEGFYTGVSMMPMLPYISDTPQQLEEMFKAVATSGARYAFPASITLFGEGPADSKTLMLEAIQKHYPELLERYKDLLSSGNEVPRDYAQALRQVSLGMCKKYGLENSLFPATTG